jgi:hypothetical protein
VWHLYKPLGVKELTWTIKHADKIHIWQSVTVFTDTSFPSSHSCYQDSSSNATEHQAALYIQDSNLISLHNETPNKSKLVLKPHKKLTDKLHEVLESNKLVVLNVCNHLQGDQKVSVHLTITVQTVPRQSPDTYWHAELCSQRPCSVQHGPHSECDWNCLTVCHL